jgi:hypothetical protein
MAVINLEDDLSPFSNTPNSLRGPSLGAGEGSVEPAMSPPTLRLARRSIVPLFFIVGDPTAEVRLEMRGILVGVSFTLPGIELSIGGGGMSFEV